MSRVTMKIDKKYLSLPISRFVGTRTVCVKKDGNYNFRLFPSFGLFRLKSSSFAQPNKSSPPEPPLVPEGFEPPVPSAEFPLSEEFFPDEEPEANSEKGSSGALFCPPDGLLFCP